MGTEREYWVAFSAIPCLGPSVFGLLLERFGSARAAWQAGHSDLAALLGPSRSSTIVSFRQAFDPGWYAAKLKSLSVVPVASDDPKYPPLLREIPDKPFVLYVRGKRGSKPIDMRRTVGIVGTRNPTAYGTSVTGAIARGLAESGFTVISGMAYGIDAVVHGAVLAAGGSTVAVLGCGVDIPAPPGNTRLYESIRTSGRGVIVSEMPPGFRPSRTFFPVRNRIISGMSLGVVVTEGARKSGSLITARYAAEQGREVFAVPGPVTSQYSSGPAFLLKSGAVLIESAMDVISVLGV